MKGSLEGFITNVSTSTFMFRTQSTSPYLIFHRSCLGFICMNNFNNILDFMSLGTFIHGLTCPCMYATWHFITCIALLISFLQWLHTISQLTNLQWFHVRSLSFLGAVRMSLTMKINMHIKNKPSLFAKQEINEFNSLCQSSKIFNCSQTFDEKSEMQIEGVGSLNKVTSGFINHIALFSWFCFWPYFLCLWGPWF